MVWSFRIKALVCGQWELLSPVYPTIEEAKEAKENGEVRFLETIIVCVPKES